MLGCRLPAGSAPQLPDAVALALERLQRVQYGVTDHREVRHGVSLADTALILAEVHVQDPVQSVFDAPVMASGVIRARRIRGETRDVVARLTPGFLPDLAP